MWKGPPNKFWEVARKRGHVAHDPPSADEAIVIARAVEGGALDEVIGVGVPGEAVVDAAVALAENLLGRPIAATWFLRRGGDAGAFWDAYYDKLKMPRLGRRTQSTGPR